MSAQSPYAQAAELLDQLRTAATVPNGARRAIATVVDALRYSHAPEEHVQAASDISVAIHKLELALCLGNAERQQEARARLDEIGESWPALVLEAA